MEEEDYMRRCLYLARLGKGHVAPNPMVGAVLVFEDRIIGEGYHAQYGQAHAEVNCLNSVATEDIPLIEKSTLYVSLEPCAHFGKTPPCAEMLVKKQVKKVVIGCIDLNPEVAGKGIRRMQEAGLEITTGVLEADCLRLNKRFFTFHEKKRPFIILKWAQTINGIIGAGTGERIFISNKYTNRLVHKWRTEEAAILVGTDTALKDDPLLTSRLWEGNNPVRIVIDKELKIPRTHKVYDDKACTIIFNSLKDERDSYPVFIKPEQADYLDMIMTSCVDMNIQSVLVEGGAKTLQGFIDKDLWDEIRIIVSQDIGPGSGLKAPLLPNAVIVKKEKVLEDQILYLARK